MGKDFTFENVERVAQAFGDYLHERFAQTARKEEPKVAIGFDRRKDSENFARTFAEVLIANGLQVFLSDVPCPTPAVSYAVVNGRLDAGVVITASHNPPDYNGIKIKTDFGGSADRSITDAIEALIGKKGVLKKPSSVDNPRRDPMNERYLTFLKSYVNLEAIKASPYRILVDSMHGVGARHLEQILEGGRIQVHTIRSGKDEAFGGVNPEPIPQNMAVTMEMMKSLRFDLAVVTDGDGDRIGAARPGGEFVSPGTILSLILLHLAQDLGRKGSVVTTISNTALIYKVARKLGLAVHETPVGFKYVCEIMRRENVLIGGEESGGIGFQNYLYERDGMLSALLLMEMMAMRKRSFEEILKSVESEFGKRHYVRSDIHYPQELKPKLFRHLSSSPPSEFCGKKVREVKSNDGMKFLFEDDAWLLFRLSGTEPLLRIYAEALSRELAEAFVREGEKLAFSLPSATPSA